MQVIGINIKDSTDKDIIMNLIDNVLNDIDHETVLLQEGKICPDGCKNKDWLCDLCVDFSYYEEKSVGGTDERQTSKSSKM